MTVQSDLQGFETVAAWGHHVRRSSSQKALRVRLFSGLVALDFLVIAGLPPLLSLIEPLSERYDALLTFLIVPFYALIAGDGRAYALGVLKNPVECARRGVRSLVLAQLCCLAVIFFLKHSDETSRLSLGITALATIASLAVARALYVRSVRRAIRGNLVQELVLMDAVAPDNTQVFANAVDARHLGIRPELDNPEMLHRFGLLARAFDRIVIASVSERQMAWSLMLKGANIDGEILVEQSNSVGAIGLGTFKGRQTLSVSRKPLSLANRIKKRGLDLALTIPLLILVLPLLAVVALAIKLEDRGPILFRQARVGRGNCQFAVLKFRSMRTEGCDAQGNRSASRDDERITRVGRIIRATSIDELPQLVNVLLGDMSLVGPRPHALGSLAGERLFWEIDETYWHRHQLKPGITGLAQIRGHRGATQHASDLTNRLQADMEYMEGWDIWRDIAILLRTFRVLTHPNAY
ncbi:hypothetical protein MTsN3n11_18320 [Qipengyuania sp. MTN3-11]